jgi:hypothetical protein
MNLFISQPVPHPIHDSGNERFVEFSIHCEIVTHALDFNVTCVTGVDLIDDLSDGLAVSPAHDSIGRAMEDQSWRIHALPDFPEIESLQLLIKGCWAAILAVG